MGTEIIGKLVEGALKGSPVAIFGVIAYGVFLVWKIAGNHLKHMEASMNRLAESSERQEKTLTGIHVGIEVLKDRSR